MGDPGPAPFGPLTKMLVECPGCGHMNKPDTLVVCGRCWKRATDRERATLALGPNEVRAVVYDRLRRDQT